MLSAIDTQILLFINRNLSFSPIPEIFNIITNFGYWSIGWIILLIIISFKKQDRNFWLYWGLTFVLVFIISELFLKNLVHRERPFSAIPELFIYAIKPSSFSFPSGHAAFSAAAFYIISRSGVTRKIVVSVFVLSILVSVSRIILKVHYTSDVIGGYIIGGFIAILCAKTIKPTKM